MDTYDAQWWKANGPLVKARLTRAEAQVRSQPQFALAQAEAVDAAMREHGYPDWWSRVERLRLDAQAAIDIERW